MQHSLDSIRAAPWAITPDRLQIIAALPSVGSGEARAPSVPAPATIGGIAVLPLVGVLVPNASDLGEILGLLSLKRFTQSFRAALADDSVRGILIDIDSPGGSLFGIQELAEEVFRARARKPIFAIADSLAASAAYWIGSSASEFYITPGGEAGSIGVFAMHRNVAKALDKAGIKPTLISAGKYKMESSPFGPLTVAARKHLQSEVDTRHDSFTRSVARNRNVDVAAVRNGMGQGRVLNAQSALAEGMADGVGSYDQILNKLARRVGQRATGDSAILRLLH
ncbi:S49 family peptidase [Caballeronia sp. SEWSISQ10-4 2]|uniref:S49 family peptidase n=1 Tax=Caballeronia sp. SEWSISQ10-4 2 TaxID=2937438 RepID=UPI0026570DDB|nr:S49 family peptidase [Caballeronia sp. SEWSISQ10-4 2]MDN7177322.1 S49 family peptidase [Caballeronia sp. SEWSISQ10-4 2]